MAERLMPLQRGRHVYGLAAIILGLTGLIWDDFATYWQIVPETIPHRKLLAYIVAACLLLAGLAIQWVRTARPAALVLSICYFMFALLWLPRVVGFPQLYGTWNGMAEELAMAAAGLVAFAILSCRDSAWELRTEQIGCLFFGVCAVSFGVEHFTAIPQTAQMIPNWLPPGPHFWAVATGVAFVLGGFSILTGVQAVLASALLTAMFFSFTALVWVPILLKQPRDHISWAGNGINLAALGAAWVIADAIASRRKDRKAS